MEQTPMLPKWFHLRMNTLMGLLALCDFAMVALSASVIMAKGPSMMMIFGFEVCYILSA